jgi:tetrahydrodipicolinate N-succinyltransferase
MEKYGWFKTSLPTPSIEYEGDYMKMEKEFVQIFKRNENPMLSDHLVAAIRLEKGQDVREIR